MTRKANSRTPRAAAPAATPATETVTVEIPLFIYRAMRARATRESRSVAEIAAAGAAGTSDEGSCYSVDARTVDRHDWRDVYEMMLKKLADNGNEAAWWLRAGSCGDVDSSVYAEAVALAAAAPDTDECLEGMPDAVRASLLALPGWPEPARTLKPWTPAEIIGPIPRLVTR